MTTPLNESALLLLVQAIQSDVSAMQTLLEEHIRTEPKEWAKVLSDLMAKSFPAGDPEGHRRFHEASIKKAEDSAAFWHDMRKSAAKWGLAGFAFWALKTLIEAGALWIQNGAHLK